MPLAVREARAAQRYALVNRAAVADLRRFTDDHAHAVIDEHGFSDLRAGMNLDARQKANDLRKPARQYRNPRLIKRMDEPVRRYRMKTRI